MSKIIEIGIAKESNKEIEKVKFIEVVAGKGIKGDRYFHDVNDEWKNKFDFIYTNSLDQSWKPKQALVVWLEQLSKNGVLIIEHTELHGPKGASEKDPFGVKLNVVPYVLTM